MSAAPEIVTTTAGRLAGSREHGLCVFRGVGYAAPPTGARRFAPPQPLERWSGVRPAAGFGPAPPQVADPLVRALNLLGDLATDEDCLSLNVWTRACDDERRPVLVFLPGGAFIGGCGAAPPYDGRQLARRGDVVVVTLSYRVGALGFLYLGAGREGGNFGLQDQVAALGWVRREIARFGGDPENVTVFGESAGAGSILALLAMPLSRGLFRRAIVQSAAPEGVIDAAEAERRARKLCEKLGVDPAERERLRSLGLAQILAAQGATLLEGPWATGMLFAPVVDGELLPQPPLAAIEAGAAREVELLIGTTEEEMRLYAGAPFEPKDEPALVRMLAFQLPVAADERERHAARIVERYRRERAARGAAIAPADLFWAIQSDLHLREPATRVAAAQARYQRATFMYLFSARSPWRGGVHGSCHALDLPFVFGTYDIAGMRELAGSGDEVERISGDLMDAWLGFARTGDPSHRGIGPWPAYDAARRATMQIGPKCGVIDAPFDRERAVWDELRVTPPER